MISLFCSLFFRYPRGRSSKYHSFEFPLLLFFEGSRAGPPRHGSSYVSVLHQCWSATGPPLSKSRGLHPFPPSATKPESGNQPSPCIISPDLSQHGFAAPLFLLFFEEMIAAASAFCHAFLCLLVQRGASALLGLSPPPFLIKHLRSFSLLFLPPVRFLFPRSFLHVAP